VKLAGGDSWFPAAWVARGMVAMMRGDRPAILLNPEIYANT
jgi:hypothetical protein